MAAGEAEVERTWHALAHRSDVSPREIQAVFERFGGAEYFGRAKLDSQADHLLTVLMSHGGLSDSAVAETITVARRTKKKASRREVDHFADHSSTLQDLNRFSEYWRVHPAGLLAGLGRLETKWVLAHPEWHDLRLTVEDPALHTPMELLDVARVRAIHEAVRAKLVATAAPGVLDLLWAEVLGKANSVREAYARLALVHDDHWAALARDSSRAVVNQAARNRLLPEAAAAELVRAHRTPVLRADVMKSCASKELLLEVYRGTTSLEVRRAVARNPLSELYLTSPAALA